MMSKITMKQKNDKNLLRRAREPFGREPSSSAVERCNKGVPARWASRGEPANLYCQKAARCFSFVSAAACEEWMVRGRPRAASAWPAPPPVRSSSRTLGLGFRVWSLEFRVYQRQLVSRCPAIPGARYSTQCPYINQGRIEFFGGKTA
eukprot:1192442-Prorocentrum_minimum.AAC.7